MCVPQETTHNGPKTQLGSCGYGAARQGRKGGKEKVFWVNKNHDFYLSSMQDFRTKFGGKPDRNKWEEMWLTFVKGRCMHATLT